MIRKKIGRELRYLFVAMRSEKVIGSIEVKSYQVYAACTNEIMKLCHCLSMKYLASLGRYLGSQGKAVVKKPC